MFIESDTCSSNPCGVDLVTSSMAIEEPKRPGVVDLSQPGRGLGVEIEVSDAAELLMSMCALSGDQDLDTFELGRTRLEQIWAAAPSPLVEAAEDLLVGSELLPAHLLGLVYTTPTPRTIDAFLEHLARSEERRVGKGG